MEEVSESKGSGQSGQSKVEFVTLTDPKENAFTVDMPKGWKTQVSMERVQNQTRSCGVSVHPDGGTRLFFGDPSLPMFTLPVPEYGIQEGMPTGNPLYQVSRFVPAERFFSDYAKMAYGKKENFKIISTDPDKAAQKEMQQKFAEQGLPNMQPDIVKVVFSYNEKGNVTKGIIAGMTMQTGNIWAVECNGFIAPEKNFEATETLRVRMVKSFKTNPEWRAKEDRAFAQRMEADRQQSAAYMQQMTNAHNQRMADMQANFNAHQQRMGNLQSTYDQQNQSWQNQQNSIDNQHKANIDVIREEQLISNGNQSAKVEAGYNNYYVNPHTNQYIGTNSELQSTPEGYEQWQPANYGEEPR